MAKAKEIVGLDCAADARQWAAEVLRVRMAEVAELRGAALNSDDIEGVHAMRVATRRLRSALRDFAPLVKRRPLKKVRRDLKRLADGLGAARDLDVAIVALEKLQTAAADDSTNGDERIKQGVGKMIEERRAARRQTQLDLMETLAVSSVEDLQRRFEKSIEAATAAGGGGKRARRAVSFSEAGRGVVETSLREFCDLSYSLYEPFNVADLHELRIAAKRLRYAIELFTACWGERVKPFAGAVAEMQSFLGEVHDCDVWIESLGRRLRENDDTGGDDDGGDGERAAAVWLLSEFAKERTKNYRQALRLWSEWRETNFVERLQAAIAETETPPQSGEEQTPGEQQQQQQQQQQQTAAN